MAWWIEKTIEEPRSMRMSTRRDKALPCLYNTLILNSHEVKTCDVEVKMYDVEVKTCNVARFTPDEVVDQFNLGLLFCIVAG